MTSSLTADHRCLYFHTCCCRPGGALDLGALRPYCRGQLARRRTQTSARGPYVRACMRAYVRACAQLVSMSEFLSPRTCLLEHNVIACAASCGQTRCLAHAPVVPLPHGSPAGSIAVGRCGHVRNVYIQRCRGVCDCRVLGKWQEERS